MPTMNRVETNTNGKNSNSYKPFFDNEAGYHAFVLSMLEAAKQNTLPIALEHSNPMNITMSDIKKFSTSFKKDTGLYIDFKQFTCNNCDRLHFYMVVDYEDEE